MYEVGKKERVCLRPSIRGILSVEASSMTLACVKTA